MKWKDSLMLERSQNVVSAKGVKSKASFVQVEAAVCEFSFITLVVHSSEHNRL